MPEELYVSTAQAQGRQRSLHADRNCLHLDRDDIDVREPFDWEIDELERCTHCATDENYRDHDSDWSYQRMLKG